MQSARSGLRCLCRAARGYSSPPSQEAAAAAFRDARLAYEREVHARRVKWAVEATERASAARSAKAARLAEEAAVNAAARAARVAATPREDTSAADALAKHQRVRAVAVERA